MTQDKKYIDRVYTALKNEVEGFNKTPEEFKESIKSEDYRARVYSALSDKIEGFNKTPEEFNALVSTDPQKKNSNSTGSQTPKGSQSKVTPKPSTSVGGKQQQAKPSVTSSSQEFEYKPILDEKGKEVYYTDKKTGQLKPAMEKVPKGTASTTEYRQAQLQDLKKRAEKPIVKSQTLIDYENATSISDKEKQTLLQEIDDKMNEKGFLNGLTTGLKKFWNNVLVPGAPMELTPYSKEREEAVKYLTEEYGDINNVNPKEIERVTKEIVLDKKLEGLKVDKNNEFLSTLDEDQKKELNIEQVQNWKTLQDKDKYIATKAPILVTEVESLSKDFLVIKSLIEKHQKEGTEIPEEVISNANNIIKKFEEKANELDKLEFDYKNNTENIGSIEEEIDFLKRNYDTSEKFKTTVALGFGDFYINATKGLPLMIADNITIGGIPLDYTTEKIQLVQDISEWEKAKEIYKEQFKKDVSFENLSISNFGEFFTQELATQLPIFAQIALPGGIYGIGATTAGNKYGQMTIEGGYSKSNMLLTSLTFGTAEAVLGSMPTKSIMSRALTSFEKSGKRVLLREGIGNYVKKKGLQITEEGLTESVSEGLTQVVQNSADIMSGKKGVSIFDGVDHAMFSGGMLGAGMHIVPAVTGLVLKPFSNNKASKQVQSNITKILSLQNELSKNNLSEASIKAINESIKGLEKENKSIIEASIKKAESMPKEVFDGIVEVTKKQEELSVKATEIKNDSNLSIETKKQLLESMEAEYSLLEDKRTKLVSGEATVLDALSDKEVNKLKEKASKLLVKDAESQGKKEASFTDEQITKKAIELYNESKQKTENIVPDVEVRPRVEPMGKEEKITPKTETDAIQEQITDEGVLRPEQSEMGLQEVVEGDQGQEVATKQSEEKVSTKVSDPYTSNEVERVKALPKESEDGATMNLDGSKYEGGGLVIPLASKNMDASELTPEAIQEFIDENAESIGEDNVKVGIYKFPNSNQVSIDISIVADPSMREEGIAIGKELGQESLFDLDTFENVKTGADGMNPKKLSPSEFRDIQQRLKPKTKGVEVSKDTNEAKKQLSKVENKKVAKAIINGVKAISKLLPNVKVIIHDTDDSFRSVSGESKNQESSGLYQNGEIHINLPKANVRTVAHEIFHAILLDKVKTDANAQTVTKKMIKSIASKIDGNPDLKAKLEEFASMYDENIQDEEKLAELVGILAENYDSFSTRVKEIIKNWLNNLAKTFGVELFESNEVFDVLNTIAKKVASGKEVSQSDVNIINSVDSGDLFENEYVNTNGTVVTVASNRKSKNKNTVVKESDIIDLSVVEGKPLEVVYYDNFTSSEYEIKNKKSGSSVKRKGEGGPGYSYREEIKKAGIVAAFTNVTKGLNLIQGVRSRNEVAKESAVIGVALQNKEKGHLGNLTTLRDFYDPTDGAIAIAVKDGIISENEAIKILKDMVDAYGKTKKGQNSKSSLGFDSNDFNSLEEFHNKIGSVSFERRGAFNDNVIPSNENLKITKSTRSYVKTWIESGIPTLSDYYETTTEPYTKEANPHDIVKYIDPNLNKIGISSEVSISDAERRRANDMGVELVEIDNSLAHTSYPVVLFGSNIGVPSTFNSVREMSKEWNVPNPFFIAGRRKDSAKPVKIPSLSDSKRVPFLRQQKALPSKVAEKLTEDGDGNFVFKHYSDQRRDVIKKGQGTNRITSREEASALGAVGGLAMFYTMANQTESGVGNVEHTILIDKNKVYDIDSDPMGFEAEARERFNEVRPGQAFTNNYRGAFITQIANENGFDIAVSQWRGSELRAQTTIELKPEVTNTNFKERPLPTFSVGEVAMIDGRESIIEAIDGNKIKYRSLDGTSQGVTINNERNRRSLVKIEPTPAARKQKAFDKKRKAAITNIKGGKYGSLTNTSKSNKETIVEHETMKVKILNLAMLLPKIVEKAVDADLFDKYKNAVLAMSEKRLAAQTVITAKEVADLYDQIIEDYTNFSEVQNAVLNGEVASLPQEQKDYYNKNKSLFNKPREETKKSDEELEEKRQELKDEVMSYIPSIKESPKEYETNSMSFKIASSLADINASDLELLTNSQLENLRRVLETISLGEDIPAFANAIHQEIESNRKMVLSSNIAEKYNKTGFNKFAIRRAITSMTDAVRDFFKLRSNLQSRADRYPLVFADTANKVFGVLPKFAEVIKGKYGGIPIYTHIFSTIDKAEGALKSRKEDVAEVFEKVNKKLLNKSKNIDDSYRKIHFAFLQVQAWANPGNKKVKNGVVSFSENFNNSDSPYSDKEKKAYREFVNKYKGYQFVRANDKIMVFDDAGNNVTNEYFTKEELEAYNAIRSELDNQKKRAEETSLFNNNNALPFVNEYFPENNFSKKASAISIKEDPLSQNFSSKTSVKSKSLLEKTAVAHPVMHNPFAVAMISINGTEMQYQLLNPIQIARKTMSKIIADNNNSVRNSEGKDLKRYNELGKVYDNIERSLETLVEHLKGANFGKADTLDKVYDNLTNIFYTGALASASRTVVDLALNYQHLAVSQPVDVQTGFKERGKINKVIKDNEVKSADSAYRALLKYISASQINRVMGVVNLTSIRSEFQSEGANENITRRGVESDFGKIKGKIGRVFDPISSSAKLINQSLISVSDNMPALNFFLGSFANEFKDATGQDFDWSAAINNDGGYMLENAEAINHASNIANFKLSSYLGSSNVSAKSPTVVSAMRGQSEGKILSKLYKRANYLFRQFTMGSNAQFLSSLNNLIEVTNKKDASEQARIMAGNYVRVSAYQALSSLAVTSLWGLLRGDDEDEDIIRENSDELSNDSAFIKNLYTIDDQYKKYKESLKELDPYEDFTYHDLYKKNSEFRENLIALFDDKRFRSLFDANYRFYAREMFTNRINTLSANTKLMRKYSEETIKDIMDRIDSGDKKISQIEIERNLAYLNSEIGRSLINMEDREDYIEKIEEYLVDVKYYLLSDSIGGSYEFDPTTEEGSFKLAALSVTVENLLKHRDNSFGSNLEKGMVETGVSLFTGVRGTFPQKGTSYVVELINKKKTEIERGYYDFDRDRYSYGTPDIMLSDKDLNVPKLLEALTPPELTLLIRSFQRNRETDAALLALKVPGISDLNRIGGAIKKDDVYKNARGKFIENEMKKFLERKLIITEKEKKKKAEEESKYNSKLVQDKNKIRRVTK